MKKLLAVALLSVTLIGISAGRAQAFFLKDLFGCCDKCYVVKCRQVNAFTPVSCCCQPCCPPPCFPPPYAAPCPMPCHPAPCGAPDPCCMTLPQPGASAVANNAQVPSPEAIAWMAQQRLAQQQLAQQQQQLAQQQMAQQRATGYRGVANPALMPVGFYPMNGYNPYAAWGQMNPYQQAPAYWNAGR